MLKLLFPILATLCTAILAGCIGSGSVDAPPDTAGQGHAQTDAQLQLAPVGDSLLPPFPVDRAASDIPALELNGVDFTEQVGGVAQGNSLLLNAPAKDIAWAVYALDSIASGQQVMADVSLADGHRYWLAVADFSLGRWSFSGPHAASAANPAGAPARVSPLGRVYVAVVCFDSQAVTVNGLKLEMSNLNPHPIFGVDPAHTGRSAYTGPQTADLARYVSDRTSIHGQVAVGADGSMYFTQSRSVRAVNPDGTDKWSYGLIDMNGATAPVIAADGRIYFVTTENWFVALNPDGSLSWQKSLSSGGWQGPAEMLTLGYDGNIYYGAEDGYLYAFSPEGSLLWRYETGAVIYGPPAQDRDCTLYVGNAAGRLLAIDDSGELQWFFDSTAGFLSSPAVDDDGSVYMGNIEGTLHALNPAGEEKWSVELGPNFYSTPALAEDSTVYVLNTDGLLQALNPQTGAQLWSYDLSSYTLSSPLIDASGTIYAGSSLSMAAVNPDGTEKWLHEGPGPFWKSTACIAPDGRLYTSDSQGVLIFGPGNSGPPHAHFSVSYTGVNPHQIRLDASASSDDDGIDLYIWTFDGGNTQISHEPVLVMDFPDKLGNLTCQLTVYDGKGLYSNAEFVTVQLPTNWNMSGGNGQHTGLALNDGPDFGGEAWWFEAPANVRSSPAIGADGTIYFGCDNRWFFAYNPDGTEKWSKDLGHEFLTNSPAVGANGTVYVAARNNEIMALDPQDGSEYWSFTTDADITTSIMLASYYSHTHIYFGCSDGTYYWLDNSPDNEVEERKKFGTTGNEARSTPLMYANVLIGLDDGDVVSYQTELTRFTADAGISTALVRDRDFNLIFGTDNGTCYSLSNYEINWTYDAGSALAGSPALGPDGSIYIATTAGKLIALEPDGSFMWEVDNAATGRTSPVVGANGIIYCAFGDLMYSYDPDGSERWSYDSFGPIHSSPAIDSQGRLVFGSDDNVLLVLGSN